MTHHLDPERVFVLGAGFSQPAGLPLGADLLERARRYVARFFSSENHLEWALTEYRQYLADTEGDESDPVDVEAFAEYLDNRHYLGMLGSDTWSEQGNRDQLLLRWGIGGALYEQTPQGPAIPSAYLRFAAGLRPMDLVVTFNYDLLLERSLEYVGIPYRRFPFRPDSFQTTADDLGSSLDYSEVVLLKLHGSIDWVDERPYKNMIADWIDDGQLDVAKYICRSDIAFGSQATITQHPLVDGHGGDLTSSIRVIESLDEYYSESRFAIEHPPLILAPSRAKLLYGDPLRFLWRGLGHGSERVGGVIIVGYSIPPADRYSRQMLYNLVSGYEHALRTPAARVGRVSRIQVVNYQPSDSLESEFWQAYRFFPRDLTDFILSGFDEEAAATIVNPPIIDALDLRQ